MGCKHFLRACATLSWFYFVALAAQDGSSNQLKVPRTRFTCSGRGSGYYADVDTGCQVYHMCDGLGRQFSYTCPNTTLFQQRMLICDHWYMVNCSMSERDYSANLLIGQRDKPFVSDEEMRFRTPRPDILSVPANKNYYDGLKEAETKFPIHPGNSIVGIADSISSANNNGLDRDKPKYRPPTSWSTGTAVNQGLSGNQLTGPSSEEDHQELTGAASQRPVPTIQPISKDFTQSTQSTAFTQNTGQPTVTPPSKEFLPPFAPSTTESPSSEEMDIDVRMKEDPVVQFINRFDPNSPDSLKTAMTKTEILDLNAQLPAGQSSAEDERTPRRNKNVGNNFNTLENDKKGSVESSRFNTVNSKPKPTESTPSNSDSNVNRIPTPEKELQPPKNDFSEQPLTTSGPPIYYEWKWAAPAFDLEIPKQSNSTPSEPTSSPQGKRNIQGRNPFSGVTRRPVVELDPIAPTKNSEYNISSYFVPDYVFPLDKPHPGYENADAETSFHVKLASPGEANYGENPACPHCHPAYLNPGTCEPCIVKR